MSLAPDSKFPFRLKLYANVFEYSKGKKLRNIKVNELLKEKYVLILGKRGTGKTSLLYELRNTISRDSKNVFFFDGSVLFTDWVGELIVRANKQEKGFIFFDDFLTNSSQNIKSVVGTLESLVRDFRTFSIYIVTDADNFMNGSSYNLSQTFKVAEIIPLEEIKEQKQRIPPIEEINFQQKTEPEIVQKQEKTSGSRRKARQFELTSTKYDDVFREVINSSEFTDIKQTDVFFLENERDHYTSFLVLQTAVKNDPDIKRNAEVINAKLTASTQDIEVFGQDWASDELWNTIMAVVRDLSKTYHFDLVLKKQTEQKRKWALDLLRICIDYDKKNLFDQAIFNYFAYFEKPESSPYILEELVKRRIVETIFEKQYSGSDFTPLIWGYFESLGPVSVKNFENLGIFITSVLMHPKIRTIWDDAQGNTPPPQLISKSNVIPKYSTDDASLDDLLDFKNDVHALAALIAYDKTPLPLAIGLFGNWGTGKSSFMKQLAKRIEVLSTKQYENAEVEKDADGNMPYASSIVQITFNAWHFSDANLWASMMVHIFDELLKSITKETDRADLKKDLLNNLSTAREALKEAEKELQESKFRVKEAEQALAKEQLTQQDIDTELKKIEYALGDVISTLMKDEQFKSAVNHTAKEIGYDKLIQSKEDLQSLTAEMTDEGKRWKRAIGNLFRGNIQYGRIFLLLFAAPLFAFILYKLDVIKIEAQIASFVVTVGSFSGWIRLQLKKFSGLRRKLESIQEREENKVREKLEQREKELKEKLALYKTSVEQKEKQVEIAKQNETNAQKALDDIDINRQLTSFIQQRQSGNNYQQHLGIISLIRNDFEALSKHLKTGREEKKNKDRIIDRIVLYIDDLDRCKTDRVVAVLEAVHLLLALDLFVVVVGVDPRWVSKALKEQYKEQLKLDADEDSDTSKFPGQRATPFDYLEKIFQVPFVLRPMDDAGAKKLLNDLFKGQVKQKEEPQKPVEEIKQGSFDSPEENRIQVEKMAKEMQEDADWLIKQMNNENEEQQRQREEKAKKEFIEQVENLSISEEELLFMSSITPIIGATARTVKRYGNLYRLLRVHNDLPNYTTDTLPVYKAVMLLLSISVSNGSIARPFFTALKDSKKAGFYDMNLELITTLEKEATAARNKMEEKSEDEKEREESLNEQLQALNQLKFTLEKLPAEVKNFSVTTLKKYSPVVSRFSFRTLNSFSEEEHAVKTQA